MPSLGRLPIMNPFRWGLLLFGVVILTWIVLMLIRRPWAVALPYFHWSLSPRAAEARRKMSESHSALHAQPEDRVCLRCGRVFPRPRNGRKFITWPDYRGRKYCSRSCYRATRRGTEGK